MELTSLNYYILSYSPFYYNFITVFSLIDTIYKIYDNKKIETLCIISRTVPI